MQEKQKISKQDEQKLIEESKEVVAKMKKLETSTDWISYKDTKVDGKICKQYKMNIGNLLATKGIVQDVEGSIEEIFGMLSDSQFSYQLDDQLKETKTLYEISGIFKLIYMRYKGIWPVSDRDFILVEVVLSENDGEKIYLCSKSCSYSFADVNGVVRAELSVGGYIIEKRGEKQCKVTYISNADPKGNLPDFVKNYVAEGQGKVASTVNGLLKKYRLKKK